MNSEPQNPDRPNPEQPNTQPQSPQGGHDVPLVPPPVEPAPSVAPPLPASPDAPPRSSSGGGARAGAIAIAVFGGLALVANGGTAAFAAVHDIVDSASPGGSGDVQSVSVAGIGAIDIDAAASDVSVRFGDVEDATLEVTSTQNHAWQLERDDEELVVSNDENPFSWLDGGWFGSRWLNNDETVVLTLPESMNDGSLDADLSLSAGSLDVQGTFDEVDIDMGAGALSMEGSARSIGAEISAGRADLDLVDVTDAEFSVSAGKLVAELANTAPRSISIDVSAGSLELTVPDETYSLTQDVSAGSLDNRLDTSGSSRHKIDATVSAGSAILRPGD